MSQNSNKLSQFWLELKRRKVVIVIAMYAGVAYILIELAVSLLTLNSIGIKAHRQRECIYQY